ncbi:MAG: hypothetical protein DRI23_04300 [Candidatus Cloacimonadota bacterium]|nr:MAG: hypothetical protein DRI23_04300 [Candidatus Cloacimonadota bacterium]
MNYKDKTREQLLKEIELLKEHVVILEKENEQFKIITENTSDNIAITTFDLKAKYLFVSPSVKQVLDYEPEDLLGKSFFDFIHPEDKKVLLPLIKKYVSLKARKLLTGKESTISETIEFRFRNKAGKWRDMHSTVNITGKYLLAVTRDITKRKLMEETLRQSEEQYRLFFNLLPYGGEVIDTSGKIVKCSPSTAQILGFEMCELIGKHITKFMTPDSVEIFKQKFPVLLSGKSAVAEIRMIRKDGTELNILRAAQPIMDDNGKVNTILALNVDITEQKLAEEQLRSQTKFIDNLIESSALSTWISDENGTAIRANPACLKFFGATEEEVIGKYNIFKDEVLIKQGYIPDLKKVFENGEIANVIIDYNFAEVEHVHVENATHKIINSTFTPIMNDDGKVTNVICQTLDITEIKSAEKEIIKAKETAERYLDMAGSMFVSLDTNGNILLINQKGLEILEYDDIEELLGKNWFDTCIPPNINKEEKKVFNKVMNCDMKGVEHYNNEVITKSGKRKIVSWYNSYIKDESGVIKYLLSSGVDITEQKASEDELRKYREHLEELVKERTVELETKTKRLEDFNKLFVGREFRIKELRTKVKELEEKLGI